MNLRCMYCQTMFGVGREVMLIGLQTMEAEKLTHYDVYCPKCRRANRVERKKLEMAAEMGEGSGAQASVPRQVLPIVAVIGEPDSGKTRTLSRLIQLLRAEGLVPGGVQQPKLLTDGRAVGYDLQDVAGGERRPFARRCEDCQDPRVGFSFSTEGWIWAAAVLKASAQDADFVEVDELGWLEADGDGHGPALNQLPKGRALFILAAVRAVCADALQRRLGDFALEIASDADAQTLALSVEDLVVRYGKGLT